MGNYSFSQQKTMTVKRKAVILVKPSQKKLNELKQESASEDEYLVIIEDGLFYYSEAKKFLKKRGIKYSEISNSKKLNFTNGSIDTSKLSWDIIFYTPNKTPTVIDITDIENEYYKYFNQ